jgi:chloramphenicol-sensitive protein RarD
MNSSPTRGATAGLISALAAYVAWGLFPVYFHALAAVPPFEILAHRVVWSVGFLVLLLSAMGRWAAVGDLLRRPRRLATLAATALLISANWLIFIWATTTGHVLDSSLGYFVNPLVSVLLGVAFLREPLSRPQLGAVSLAATGVLWLVISAGQLPWISLALALSFGLYGLLRKRAAVDSVAGLFIETLLLAPLAALWLGRLEGSGAGHFSPGGRLAWLLAASGALTALPLIWFAQGVQRLRLSTVGLLQYVAPSLQFGCAVLLYGESFTRAHAVAFSCIWASLAVYSADALQAARRLEVSPSGPGPRGAP